jgi:ADP-heptose:LPS heptosyltransferase
VTSLFLFVMLPTWLAIGWRKYLAKRPNVRVDRVNSIIVVRLDQLGDQVLTTPLFRQLRRLYPAARITLVVPVRYKSIFATNRSVDEILPLREVQAKWMPRRAQQLASAVWFYVTYLRHKHFDLVISPRWDMDESLATMLCVLTNAGKRIAYSSRVSAAKRRFNRGFDAALDIVVPSAPLQHEVQRNLAIIEALGGSVADRGLEIRLTESDQLFAAELLRHHDNRRVLVALGIGGRAPGRRWPLERFAECIATLNQQRWVQPVVVCSPEEDREASALSVMLPMPSYVLSRVPLRTVCAVLRRCSVLLSNDTGAAHLAAAMECPTVVVSRHPVAGDPNHPNSPSRFAPWCKRSTVLQPVNGLDTCSTSCRSAKPHCILQVNVAQVVEAVLEFLPPEASRMGLQRGACSGPLPAPAELGHTQVAVLA